MSVHNPYKPPATRVADLPAPDSSDAVDRHVLRACVLIWWSFGAAMVGAAIRLALSEDMRLMIVRLIGAAIGAAIAFFWARWTTSKLKAGRNWMRLLITVIQVGGLALVPLFWGFYKPLLVSLYSINPAYAVTTAIQWTLGLSATVMMNTPTSRSWFAAMKRASSVAA